MSAILCGIPDDKLRSIVLDDAEVCVLVNVGAVDIQRALTPQPEHRGSSTFSTERAQDGSWPRRTEPSWYWRCHRLGAGYCHTNESAFIRLAEGVAPFGKVGERRWVREAWAPCPEAEQDPPETIWYRATNTRILCNAHGERVVVPAGNIKPPAKWNAARSMRRWGSRLMVDVVDVDVRQIDGRWMFCGKLRRAS